MTNSKNVLPKQCDVAFNKNVYLLGSDKDGIKYWLEAPKWECNWYWGFGYVETYTKNSLPSRARDIDSHQHINSSFLGSTEVYNHEKGCFVKGEYISNIYESPNFIQTTFNKEEGWILSELFQEFYTVKKMAELLHREGAGITRSPLWDLFKNIKEYETHINKVLIPAITAKIIEILTPNNNAD